VRKSRTGQEAEEMGVQDGLPANLEAQAISQMVQTRVALLTAPLPTLSTNSCEVRVAARRL
jgi:hypothetical protein